MDDSLQKRGNAARLDQSTEQLLDLAWCRVPADTMVKTVGDIVDAGLPWDDPVPGFRYFIWRGSNSVKPEQMAATVRSHVLPKLRGTISSAHLLKEVKDLAFLVGEGLLDHRDTDRARSDARQQLQALVDRLNATDERWDIILPIVNLRLSIQGEAIAIGPVLLVREGLCRYLWHGDSEDKLGEFGRWAVEHFDLRDPERRKLGSGALEEITAYGKVANVRGDRQGAIERARRDIDAALAILRVSYHLYGSWSPPERYGTFGPHFDPVDRFGVMGTTPGGYRITLSAASSPMEERDAPRQGMWAGPVLAQVARRQPGEFAFRMDRTDVLHPVEVTERVLRPRWPVIEQLASVHWSQGTGWSELAIAARLFAEGTVAATAEDAFLKYVIALDVLLGREERGHAESQVTRISERLAFLLGEADPDRRWRLVNACKDIYRKRSSIVHGGASVDEAYLYLVESIARLAILRMAWEIRHREHRKLEDFLEWVRKLKFGEPLETIDVPGFLQLADHWFDHLD